MKRILLALVVMLSIAAPGYAKTLIIVNHTPCEWFITPHMDMPYGTAPTTGGTFPPFANVVGLSTYYFNANTPGWRDFSGTPIPYDPTWFWSYVTVSPCLCPKLATTVSGTDMNISTYWTTIHPDTSLVSTCCGDNRIEWHDLLNGDVQIDIY
jgi:hypothetical protein